MVLIIKEGGKYFIIIGLVKVLWKATIGIINQRPTSVILYHDISHGFRTGHGTRHGTGTANLEANLLQQMMSILEAVLYTIFLDLYKAYDAVDQCRCLDMLAGYRMVTRMLRLLWTY